MAFDTKRTSREAGGDLGQAMRSIRRRKDCGQAGFARLLGWPQATLSQYECGDAPPSAERLIALLRLAAGDDERGPILEALSLCGVFASDLNPARTECSARPSTDDNLDTLLDGCRTPVKSTIRSARGTQRGGASTTSGGAKCLTVS